MRLFFGEEMKKDGRLSMYPAMLKVFSVIPQHILLPAKQHIQTSFTLTT
jgi:hypothetical protein